MQFAGPSANMLDGCCLQGVGCNSLVSCTTTSHLVFLLSVLDLYRFMAEIVILHSRRYYRKLYHHLGRCLLPSLTLCIYPTYTLDLCFLERVSTQLLAMLDCTLGFGVALPLRPYIEPSFTRHALPGIASTLCVVQRLKHA